MRCVTIAGGGLAGLSLGIIMRRAGVPVTLHEASTFPRHRVCGEFIAGRGGALMEAMELDTLKARAIPLRETCWYGERSERYRAVLPEAALGLSRYALDAGLAEEFVALGGDLQTHSRLKESDDEGVVWATGRERSDSEWLGLKFHVRNLRLEADLELHLGNGAYVGASPVEDGSVNVCGLFRVRREFGCERDEVLLRYLHASKLRTFAGRVQMADVEPGTVCGVSSFSFGSPHNDQRLRIGDQRCMMAPFTGNGMSLAMEQAEAVAPALVEWAQERRVWQECLKKAHEKLAHFDRRLRRARRLQSMLLSRQGRRALWGAARLRVLPFGLLYGMLH